VGTFVNRSLAGASLSRQAELRDDLIEWLNRAQTAGLSTEDVIALFDTTMRATLSVLPRQTPTREDAR
jgi:GntR family transcriptional regulator